MKLRMATLQRLRDSRPCMTSEKAPCDYSRSATCFVQELRVLSVDHIYGQFSFELRIYIYIHTYLLPAYINTRVLCVCVCNFPDLGNRRSYHRAVCTNVESFGCRVPATASWVDMTHGLYIHCTPVYMYIKARVTSLIYTYVLLIPASVSKLKALNILVESVYSSQWHQYMYISHSDRFAWPKWGAKCPLNG